jgi:hypothetical protein
MRNADNNPQLYCMACRDYFIARASDGNFPFRDNSFASVGFRDFLERARST